jgi:IS30 family transposase
MSYQQLTEGRRYQISALLDQSISIALIAKSINCHRATVYRELKRCNVQDGYYPDSAQNNACKTRRHSAIYTIPNTRINFVHFLLQHDWNPEQISQVLSGMNQTVSHEWIYRFVARNKLQGDKLYRHLRTGHKRYRRGKKEKAPAIKNGTSIESRPAIIDTRERFGDWVIDTVLGKHGTGSIVTILE